MLSADKEMSEIIRRRLFEWEGLSNDAKATVSAYAEWAADHAQELAGVDRDAVLRAIQGELSVPSFGAFGLRAEMAKLGVPSSCYGARSGSCAIPKAPEAAKCHALAPLDNPIFRIAVLEQLGNTDLETPVTADIAGKTSESHSLRLDREASEVIKKSQLHRKVATTIFFESNGGQSQARAEASRVDRRRCAPF